jgi:DedD protein
VQVSDGRRIRVRIGPFESRAQADAAAEKIRKLDLPAAVLEL